MKTNTLTTNTRSFLVLLVAGLVSANAAVASSSGNPSGFLPDGAGTPPRFIVPSISNTTGVLPQDLATADFNNDGKADVAVANLGPDAFVGGVDVMLGDGAGHLGAPIHTSLGVQNGAYQVAAGEFNGDGKADLAVLTGTTGGYGPIYILLGTGTGSFATQAQQLSAGEGNIAVADLTGDGKDDIVFVFTGSAEMKLYTGNGDGTFMGPTIFNRTWDAYDFKLADVNADGLLDIVGAAGGPIWSMLNLGGGQFSQQIFQTSSNLSGWQLAVEDFTGDGKADVAVLNASGGDVQIGLGVGDGSFTPFKTYNDVSFATNSIAASDWTGDGKVDLIVNNEYAAESNIVVLMKGKGDGTFGTFTYWVTGNDALTPADLNGDGAFDLLTFSSDPGQVYATLNTGRGKFLAPQSFKVAGLGSPAKGDINGDGKLDLVTIGTVFSQQTGFTVETFTYLNQGRGRFAKAVVSQIQAVDVYDGPTQIVLADVNEDGKLDLVSGFYHLFPKVGNVWVLFGDGTGRFSNLQVLDTGDVHASNNAIAVADVTGDGNLDIIGNSLSQLSVLPGNGNGTFGSPILTGSSSSSHTDLLVADFTLDGILDVVAVIRTGGEDFGSGELRLERGNGNGTFTLIQTSSFDGNPNDAQVADLNGDTKPDVAVTGTSGSNGGRTGLRIALNNSGTFAPIVFYQNPPFPFGDIEVADFDLDGDIDVVGTGSSSLAIALNNGTGTFTGTFDIIISSESALVAGDFTNDGKPDLVSLNPTNIPQFSLYVNSTR